jgi:hypothetical protein
LKNQEPLTPTGRRQRQPEMQRIPMDYMSMERRVLGFPNEPLPRILVNYSTVKRQGCRVKVTYIPEKHRVTFWKPVIFGAAYGGFKYKTVLNIAHRYHHTLTIWPYEIRSHSTT